MGVSHARVEIEDRGALPFVIDAARRGCGARELGRRRRRAALDARTGARASHSGRSRRATGLRRSRLYLPGNEPKYMINAGSARVPTR